MAEIDLVKEAAPATPASTYGRFFFDTIDKKFKQKDDTTLVRTLANEYVNVLDYGAKGDGVPDDTTAIQNAINNTNAGGLPGDPVYIPAGHYKITTSLIIPSTFAGMCGPGRTNEAYIEPNAQTFAAFINKVGDYGGAWEIRDLTVNYGVATGNVVATNPLSAGFYITGAAFAPSQYRMTNINVTYAYYGYYDTSVSNLVLMTSFISQNCNTGFLKNNGTTFTFVNCYALVCATGWACNGSIDMSLISCALQSITSAGLVMVSMHGLTINSLDYESNTLAGASAAMFTFSNCRGFTANGIRGTGNTFATGGGGNTQYVVNCNSNAMGVFTSCSFGSAGTDTATGAGGFGTTLTFDATAMQITFVSCALAAMTAGTGAPTVALASVGNAAGQQIIFQNCLYSGTVTDAGFKVIYFPDSSGNFTFPSGTVKPAIGTATLAPLQLTSGTNLTNAVAGGLEFDGASFYKTADVTTGRQVWDGWQFFRLTANGTPFTAITDFFGTNDGIPTVLNAVYEIEWHCYFAIATLSTQVVTWTIVNTQTVTNMVAGWAAMTALANGATAGALTGAAVVTQTAASVALPASGVITIGNHYHVVRALIEAGTAGNVRLRAATASTATIGALRDSYFKVRRLPAANVGTYVA